MAKLLYQGHGSYRITSDNGAVVYLDPFIGEGYDAPASLILVTHQHSDHNRVDLPARAPGCIVITEREALRGGKHQSFSVKGIDIRAVEAKNRSHDPHCCVGYLLTVDGVTVYASGDTSTTEEMADMAAIHLDYVLLPIDGIYNMDAKEASECARIIGAKHSIPIHMKPGVLFDRRIAETFDAPGRLIVEPGEEITL